MSHHGCSPAITRETQTLGPPRARNCYGHVHDIADTFARPSKRFSGFIKHLEAVLDVRA